MQGIDATANRPPLLVVENVSMDDNPVTCQLTRQTVFDASLDRDIKKMKDCAVEKGEIELTLNLKVPTPIKWPLNLVLPKSQTRAWLTPERVTAILSKFGSVDVRHLYSHTYLLAANSRKTYDKLLVEQSIRPGMMISPYNFYRHSRLGRGLLW